MLRELFLGIRVADGVVVRSRLVDLLNLPRVVLNVLEHLIRILRF